MRRPVLAAVTLVIAALAGCGGSAHPNFGGGTDNVTAGPSDAPASIPATQLDQCIQVLTAWESANIDALNQGFTGGENLNDIITQYGSQGPIFHAALTLQSRLLVDVSAHGLTNLPIYDFRQICTDAGASASSGASS